MTLLEALQDIGKGRIYDNGCEYHLGTLASGVYSFHFWNREPVKIELNGTPKENAGKIETEFYKALGKQQYLYNEIIRAHYRKK